MDTPLILPFAYDTGGDASEKPFVMAAVRRGVVGGRGAPFVGVGARSIRLKASGGGLDTGEV